MNEKVNLLAIVERQLPPTPWAEGEKIPWHEPEFSARMLHEHLSQEHNAASRRSWIIDQHVEWLHTAILSQRAGKVLDLGCGPGLYTSRLARLGHTCVGIDFAPASIAYARQQAEEDGLACRYIEADVREASFGTEYDLIMMIHGEINVFKPEETRRILENAREAMASGGKLVLEVHTLAAVQGIGSCGRKWNAFETGLFSARPHLLLEECHWDAGLQVATERYYVVDVASGEVTRHAASIQGYDEDGYVQLLESCGFTGIRQYPSLGGLDGEKDRNYVVFVAEKAAP